MSSSCYGRGTCSSRSRNDWRPDWLKAGITESPTEKLDELAGQNQTPSAGESPTDNSTLPPPEQPTPPQPSPDRTDAVTLSGVGEPAMIAMDAIDAFHQVRDLGCSLAIVPGKPANDSDASSSTPASPSIRISGADAAIAAARPIVVAHKPALLELLVEMAKPLPDERTDEQREADRIARARRVADDPVAWLIDLVVTHWISPQQFASEPGRGDRRDLGYVREGTGDGSAGKWLNIERTAKRLYGLVVTQWDVLDARARSMVLAEVTQLWRACRADVEVKIDGRIAVSFGWRASDYEWPKGHG